MTVANDAAYGFPRDDRRTQVESGKNTAKVIAFANQKAGSRRRPPH